MNCPVIGSVPMRSVLVPPHNPVIGPQTRSWWVRGSMQPSALPFIHTFPPIPTHTSPSHPLLMSQPLVWNPASLRPHSGPQSQAPPLSLKCLHLRPAAWASPSHIFIRVQVPVLVRTTLDGSNSTASPVMTRQVLPTHPCLPPFPSREGYAANRSIPRAQRGPAPDSSQSSWSSVIGSLPMVSLAILPHSLVTGPAKGEWLCDRARFLVCCGRKTLRYGSFHQS